MRIVLSLLLLAACSKSEAAKQEPAVTSGHVAGATSKNPAKAKQMMAAHAVVIDVRTPEEYSGDHLAQAANIPIAELSSHLADVDKLTGGDKAAPVVVYCASGGRAKKAMQKLEAVGYTNVVNGGGLDDLQ